MVAKGFGGALGFLTKDFDSAAVLQLTLAEGL